jgi:hypothetical protein
MAGLSFTKDQIKKVLQDFIVMFENGSFMDHLKSFAPNEQKMNQFIEVQQKGIFTKHGVDPERGYADLSRIVDKFGTDPEVKNLLMFSAMKEEAAISYALQAHSLTGANPQQKQLETILRVSVDEFQQQLTAVQQGTLPPEQKAAFQQAIQQQIMQMPPEQRALLLQHLGSAMSQAQPARPTGSTPAPKSMEK